MSDINANANRYSRANTFRSDVPGATRGNGRSVNGKQIGFDCSGLVYHVLRESGFDVPYATSGAMKEKNIFNGDWATSVAEDSSLVGPGTLVYFNGHVGIVQTFDPIKKVGDFLSMTGKNNSGAIQAKEAFTTDSDHSKGIYWGGPAARFKGFAAVKQELYDPKLDQHANGANADTAVFNIPEASNSGFITLANNGGFRFSKGAADLSTRASIAALGSVAVPQLAVDLSNNKMSFATKLAELESQGQPNDGYGAWRQDGSGIGAIGRYGFRAPSLKAIGWMEDGNIWTEKARENGVTSNESFRDTPRAQEVARVLYLDKLKNELISNGAWTHIGETVGEQQITQSGLLAAAWKEGSGSVAKFFAGTATESAAKNIKFRLARFRDAALTGEDVKTASGAQPDGHWEDTNQYDALGNLTVPGERVWVPNTGSALYAKAATAAPVDHNAAGSTYISRDGRTAIFLNGDVLTAAEGGSLQWIDGEVIDTRPASGYPVTDRIYNLTVFDRGGLARLSRQYQLVADPEHPGEAATSRKIFQGDPAELTYRDAQGIERKIGAVFQVGLGWVDPGSGEQVLSIAQGQAALIARDPVDGAKSEFRKLELDAQQSEGLEFSAEEISALQSGLLMAASATPGRQVAGLGNDFGVDFGEEDSGGLAQALEPAAPGDLANHPDLDLASAEDAQANGVAGLVNSLLGTRGWNHQSDLQRARTLLSIHQQVDTMSGGALDTATGVGDLKIAGTTVGLIAAFLNRDRGGIAMNGIGVVDAIWNKAASNAIGSALSLAESQSDAVVPGIGLVLAVRSGNPYSIASSAVSLMTALQVIPVYGQVIAAAIAIAGILAADDEPQIQIGQVRAGWGDAGRLAFEVLRDQAGGSETAGAVLASVTQSLQEMLAADPGLDFIPALLPQVGYLLEPAGDNADRLRIDWTDANGNHTRYYDSAGNPVAGRDGTPASANNIAQEFAEIAAAQGAIAPANDVQDLRAAWIEDNAAAAQMEAQLSTYRSEADALRPLRMHGEGENSEVVWYTECPDLDRLNQLDQWIAGLAGSLANARGEAAFNLLASIRTMHERQAQEAEISVDPTGVDATAPIPSEVVYGDMHGGELVSPTSAEIDAHNRAAVMEALRRRPRLQRARPLADVHAAPGISTSAGVGIAGQAAGIQPGARLLAGDARIASDLPAPIRAPTSLKAAPPLQVDAARQIVLPAIANVRSLGVPAAPSTARQMREIVSGMIESGSGLLGGAAVGPAMLTGIGLGAGAAPILALVTSLAASNEARAATSAPFSADTRYRMVAGANPTEPARDPELLVQRVAAIQLATLEAPATLPLLLAASRETWFTGIPVLAMASSPMPQPVRRVLDAELQPAAISIAPAASVGTAQHGTVVSGASPTAAIAHPPASVNVAVLRDALVEVVATQPPIAPPPAFGNDALPPTAAEPSRTTLVPIRLQDTASPPGDVAGAFVAPAAPSTATATATAVSTPDAGLPGNPDDVTLAALAPAETGPMRSASTGSDSEVASRPEAEHQAALVPALSVEAERHDEVERRTADPAAGATTLGAAVQADGQRNETPVAVAPAPSSVTAPVSANAHDFSLKATVIHQTADGLEDTDLLIAPAQLGQDDPQHPGHRLVVAAVAGARHGAVVVDDDGFIRFSPDPEYSGHAGFSYSLQDEDGAASASSGTVDIAFAAVNDAPITVGETADVDEGSTVLYAGSLLLANDTDSEGDPLSIVRVGDAGNGEVELTQQGDALFVPFAPGDARFSYWVADGQGGESEATVRIAVHHVNHAPVVLGETFGAHEDESIAIAASQLLRNDVDPDAGTMSLRLISVGQAANGNVELDADGLVTFTPDANFHGAASFRYTVTDAEGATGVGEVAIAVAPVNDAPMVSGERVEIEEDTVAIFRAADLLANDHDVDSPTEHDVLRIASVGNPQHGTVAMDAAGRITFLPQQDYAGMARFEYQVSDRGDGDETDGAGHASVACVDLVIAAVNDVPRVVGESLAANEDRSLRFQAADLLRNDSDPDNDAIEIALVSTGEHGTAVLDSGTQEILFTPERDFHGDAGFGYLVRDGNRGESWADVRIHYEPVNDAPLARQDAIETVEDAAFTILAGDLLRNDFDADLATDGQALAVLSVSAGTHASVSRTASGDIRFVADADFHGTAGFDYTVSDGAGGLGRAHVDVELAPVNDAPEAMGEFAAGQEDRVLLFDAADLLANDTDADGDALALSGVLDARHGSAVLDSLQGMVRFTPEENYSGPAGFSYLVSDGGAVKSVARVAIELSPVNDMPVTTGETIFAHEDEVLAIRTADLLANDFDVEVAATGLSVVAVGSASAGNAHLDSGTGTIVYTPDSNYHGLSGFDYLVDDGDGGRTSAHVDIVLEAVNDAPAAGNDQVQTLRGIALDLRAADLLANDSDADAGSDGGTLQLDAVFAATNGEVAFSGGMVRFIPHGAFQGTAGFDYTVNDGQGLSARGHVQVDVLPRNWDPEAHSDSFAMLEDGLLIVAPSELLANDTDADEDLLSVTEVGDALHGSVATTASGYRFTPEPDYAGPAGFSYLAADGNGGHSQGWARVEVMPQDDAPIVTGETISADEDTPLDISAAALLANDVDIDTDPALLRIASVWSDGPAMVSLSADGGTVHFSSVSDFHGATGFGYTVTDAGGSASGWARVDIAAVNDAPSALGEDFGNVWQNAVQIFAESALLANDTDRDGDTLSVAQVSAAQGGAVWRAGGYVTFMPTADYRGPAGFDYLAADGNGGQAMAHVGFNFLVQNTAPQAAPDRFQTLQGATLALGADALLANDNDAETPRDLVVSAVGGAYNGSVTLTGGDVSFIPAAGYWGPAGFSYSILDPQGAGASGSVAVDVLHVNHAPTARDLVVSVPLHLSPEVLRPLIDPTGNYHVYSLGSASVPTSALLGAVSDADGDPLLVTVKINDATSFGTTVFGGLRDGLFPNPAVPGWWTEPGSANSFITQYEPAAGMGAVMVYDAIAIAHDARVVEDLTSGYLAQAGAVHVLPYVVTDSSGAATAATISFVHSGLPPVALDVDGAGINFTSLAQSQARFDANADGVADATGWVAPGTALLAYDREGDGLIDRTDEISFTAYKPGARTDLEGLQGFDTNANMQLDRGDTAWLQFGVWRDAGSDGRSAPGEFTSLEREGIVSIDLSSDHVQRVAGEAVIDGASTFTRADGSHGEVADVSLAFISGAARSPAQAADARTEAAYASFAQRFLDACATADAPQASAAALGFVPIEAVAIEHDEPHGLALA